MVFTGTRSHSVEFLHLVLLSCSHFCVANGKSKKPKYPKYWTEDVCLHVLNSCFQMFCLRFRVATSHVGDIGILHAQSRFVNVCCTEMQEVCSSSTRASVSRRHLFSPQPGIAHEAKPLQKSHAFRSLRVAVMPVYNPHTHKPIWHPNSVAQYYIPSSLSSPCFATLLTIGQKIQFDAKEVGKGWPCQQKRPERRIRHQLSVACDQTWSPNIATVIAQVQRLPACSKAIGLWGMFPKPNLAESRHVWRWPSPHFINIHKLWAEGRTGGDSSLVAGLVSLILLDFCCLFFLYHCWPSGCRKPSGNHICKRNGARSVIVTIEGEPQLQICLCALFHHLTRSIGARKILNIWIATCNRLDFWLLQLNLVLWRKGTLLPSSRHCDLGSFGDFMKYESFLCMM